MTNRTHSGTQEQRRAMGALLAVQYGLTARPAPRPTPTAVPLPGPRSDYAPMIEMMDRLAA